MAKEKFILQRWWINKGWVIVEVKETKKEIMQAFNGWTKQIRDGTFRALDMTKKSLGGGKVIAKRYGSFYKKYRRKQVGEQGKKKSRAPRLSKKSWHKGRKHRMFRGRRHTH